MEIGRRVVGIDSQMFIAGGEHIPPPQQRIDRLKRCVIHRQLDQVLHRWFGWMEGLDILAGMDG